MVCESDCIYDLFQGGWLFWYTRGSQTHMPKSHTINLKGGDALPPMYIYIIHCQNACIDHCHFTHITDGANYPANEKLDLRFIVFSTVSSAANILVLASIFVIIVIAVRSRKSQRNDTSSGNESTEATAVYDEINLHPPSSANIDTKENVAYRQTIFM